MFGTISSSFGKIFGKLSSKATLTEKDIIEAIDEIKIALLDADVTVHVAEKLIADIKEDLIGKSLPKNLSPSDAIASIVQKRLVTILGGEFKGIKPSSAFNVILLTGPYGSGKTTTAIKLAKHLQKKYQVKVCVASVDNHRPAAPEQLKAFAQKNDISCMEYQSGLKSETLVENAIISAQKQNFNVIILDCPGTENEDGYTELKSLHKVSHANQSIIVLDSMLGKQSIEIAKKFCNAIPLTGVILTKSEGDSRGGAAINVRHETNLQIQYLGTGEGGDALEEFHPDRIASRLLDRGDIDSIIEKAYEEMGDSNLNSMKDRVVAGQMTFNDYLTQIRSMKKMGGLAKVMSFLPGASQMGDIAHFTRNLNFEKQEAIILSMTKKERYNPSLLEKFPSRRVRISKGSGTTLADVKQLLNQLQKMKDMAKVMAKMQNNGISMDDLKNFDVNKLRQLMK